MKHGAYIVAGIGGLMSGIGSRSFLLLEWWHLPIAALLVGCVACFFARYARTAFIMLMVFLALYGVGAWRFGAVERSYEASVAAFAHLEGSHVSFDGRIVGDPDVRERTTILTVQPDARDTLFRISVEGVSEARYGDTTVSVAGVLERPLAFETELGRTFRYEGYLRAQGVTHAISRAAVEVITTEGGNPLIRMLFGVKHQFAEGVRVMLPEPHASLALGLLLGEKHGLGSDIEATFRAVGIIHIVVLSGYNLTIIAEALMRLLAQVARPRTRAAVGALAILAFAVMVGPSATVIRATMMALLVLYARATGRTYDALRALLCVGAGMVLLSPYALCFDPGFQFSFLATLGLIIGGPLLNRSLQKVPSAFGIREYMTSTIATQIAVTPLILFSIGSVSLIAVIANTLILAAVPLAMLGAFLAGLIGIIAPALIVVGYPAYLLLSYILAAADLFARVPFAELRVPPFPLWAVGAAYGALGLSLVMVKRKIRSTADMPAPRTRAQSL